MRLTDETIARARVVAPLLRYVEQRTGQTYRHIAKTGGGEYAGPCPFCGGRDRFRLWPEGDPPRWWCRACEAGGDLISFVQRREGLVFADAVAELLGGDVAHGGIAAARVLAAPDASAPPPELWRRSAAAFCNRAMDTLWSEAGTATREWIERHWGLDELTLLRSGLGWSREARHEPRSDWGLPDEPDGRGVYLPRGIVFPWEMAGEVWRVMVRRPKADGDPKYMPISGGANIPYRADGLRGPLPAVICEAAADALAVQQAAGGLVTATATGTTGARRVRWIAQLAARPVVLLAFDQDKGGEAPLRYWQETLPNAVPWRPYYDDPAAMLAAGMDLHAWVAAGLEYANSRRDETPAAA